MSVNLFVRAAAFGAVLGASSVSAATISSQVGDRDSFGTGININNQLTTQEVANGTHEASDPAGFDKWNPGKTTWTHSYTFNGETITGATLEVSTFDLEDNGACDGSGADFCDTTLFLDGKELIGAFDDVFTKDAPAGFPHLYRNVTVFNLGAEFFPFLEDGMLQVILDPYAGVKGDHIAIDYAVLNVFTSASEPDVAAVPLPLGGALLLTGLLGLGALRRRAS